MPFCIGLSQDLRVQQNVLGNLEKHYLGTQCNKKITPQFLFLCYLHRTTEA